MIGFLTKLRIEVTKLLFISILSIITASAFGSEGNQEIQLPEIERRSFLNGMELLFFEGNPEELPFAVMIKNGAAFDPNAADFSRITPFAARVACRPQEDMLAFTIGQMRPVPVQRSHALAVYN